MARPQTAFLKRNREQKLKERALAKAARRAARRSDRNAKDDLPIDASDGDGGGSADGVHTGSAGPPSGTAAE